MEDIASLGLKIDSREVDAGATHLDRLTASGAKAEKQTERLTAANRAFAAEARGASAANVIFAQTLGTIGILAAANQVKNLADSYTVYTNQLKVAGLEGTRLTGVQDQLFGQAQKYGVELKALGTLYGRVSQAGVELGATQTDLLKFTNGVAAAIKVQGGAASESSGALLQLSQLLGAHLVQAQEFNSINDGARPILQAVANGIDKYHGSISRLRADVLKQKVTNEEFFQGFLKGSTKLEEQATHANLTISNSFQIVNNALGRYIGQQNEALSATQQISGGLISFSKHIDDVVPAIVTLTAYVGVRYAAAGATFVATEAARAVAIVNTAEIERVAAVSSAQASATRAAARASDLALTEASITGARVEAVSRLNAANVIITSQRGVIASTYQVQLAERARNAALAELAVLGQQAARVNGEIAVTARAAAAAEAELAVATKIAGGAGTAARGVLGSLVGFLGGPWGVAFTVAAVAAYGLYKAIQATHQPSQEATKITNALSEATKGYEQAAYAASEASGEARVSALKEAAAKKELAFQARDAAKAQLAQAEATVALIVAENNRAIAAERYSSRGDAAGTIKPTLNQGRLNKAQADADASQAAIDAAKKSIANADRILAAGQVTLPPLDPKRDKHAESLAREAAASIATTKALMGVAKAYAISDVEGLKAQARADAVGQAIKRQGDIDAFVSRKLAENAARAAADGSRSATELNFETDQRKKLNDQVAAGLITQDTANQLLKDSTDLRGLEAFALSVEGDQRKDVLAVVERLRDAYARSNAEIEREQLIKQKKDGDDELAFLREEFRLIGATNAEREVALATLRATQQLGEKKAATPEGKAIIKNAGDAAKLADDNRIAQNAYNDSLTMTLDLLSQIGDTARDAGQGLADAFGRSGEALANLTNVVSGFQVTQARIATERKAYVDAGGKDEQRLALFAKQSRDATIHYYGDQISAVKGLFSEKSKAYKALEVAEKAYRLYEFALSVQSIVQKGIEIAAIGAGVAAKVAAVGPTVAADTATAASGTAAGAGKIFAALGPFGFPVVAAMVAVMAGLGLKALSASGGSGPKVDIAAERQKTQGAGSVLGDATAKSESIANSLEIVAKNTNSDLEYSNSMLRALRSIDTNISSLTAALARELGVGGALSTADLGLGTSSSGPGLLQKILNPIAAILPGLFGKTKTTTLQDLGLSFDPQSLDSIINGGLNGDSFSTTSTQTKKKFFGITYSNKTKTSTTETPLEADILAEMQRVIASLRDGVLAGAGVLGVEGADATLKAFQVTLGTISLKDLTGKDLEDAINSVFSKLGDELAQAAVPTITELQKVGEGAFETLARVARDYQVVDITLRSIGEAFGAVGVSSLKARENLIDLFGSLDEFVDKTSFFAENFLSEAERIAPIQAAVTAEFQRLGVTGVNTKDQFKQLVLGLDLTSQGGRDMYAALLQVAPAFSKVIDYLTTGSKDLTDAKNLLSDAYDREASAIETTRDKFNAFAQTLRDFRSSLDTGPNALLTPEGQYKATKAAFESTAAKAKLGDADALSDLQRVSQAYLDASRAYYASSGKYFADLTAVKDAVSAAEQTATRTASNADQQLDALKASVSGLIEINKSVLSVVDAIAALRAVMATATVANASATTPFSPATSATGSTAPAYTYGATTTQTGSGFNGAGYLAANPDVAAAYAAYLADQQAWASSGYGVGDTPDQFAADHYRISGKQEGRTGFARGGAFGPGGIVTRPTSFQTGEGGAVAGEAGWEGALPLANVGGRLGVYAKGSNDNAEVVELLRAEIGLLKDLLAEAKSDKQQRARVAEAVVDSNESVGRRIERAVQTPSTAQLKSGGRA